MSSGDEEKVIPLPSQATRTGKELEAGPVTVIDTEPTDTFLVDFVRPYDPTNPRDWSLRWKVVVTGLMSVTGFNRILVSTVRLYHAPDLSFLN